MTENTIQTVQIKRILNECDDIKTILFEVRDLKAPKPGQFMMIWVPGVDEIPMSISGCNEAGLWSIAVKNVGECTKALHELKVGDYIGVRGPLGNYFKIPRSKEKIIILVGGGIGMAPLKYLAEELQREGHTFKIIEGAKIDDELIFVDDFFELTRENSEFFCCTDDGSYGDKGFTTEKFDSMIIKFSKEDLKKTIVYTCGPEIMMYKLLQTCQEHSIEMYASLERIMRCGCGLCGLCAIDPVGKLVCKDGPIFSADILDKMKDFGKKTRDFAGKKKPL